MCSLTCVTFLYLKKKDIEDNIVADGRAKFKALTVILQDYLHLKLNTFPFFAILMSPVSGVSSGFLEMYRSCQSSWITPMWT